MSDSSNDLKKQVDKLKKLNETNESRITALLKDKESLDLKIQQLEKTNSSLNQEIAQALGSADISLVRKNADLLVEKEKMALSNDNYKQKIATLEKEQVKYTDLNKNLSLQKSDLETKLQNVQSTIRTSFSAEDLSQYLSKTIDDFNKNTTIEDTQARYVINSFDIDLKAQVFQDDNNNLRFSAPNLEKPTENSLSSIKISIRAIPK